MRIVYRSRKARPLQSTGLATPTIELSWDNWDDYSYKTTFQTKLHSKGATHVLNSLKILVRGEKNTARHFEALVEAGWDGEFPPPIEEYISNPTSLLFWEVLIGETSQEEAVAAATLLRDASLLTRVREEPQAMALVGENAFGTSLLRERGGQQAFNHGWKLLDCADLGIDDLRFRFVDPQGEIQSLDLSFADGLMPHDINVIIGPNGAGKSQALTQLISHWLQVDDLPPGTGFSTAPNLSQIVAISYSPFELTRVDTKGLNLADVDVYRYFGLRGREAARAGAPSRVTLSLDHARNAAVASLVNCAEDDQRYSMISDWSRKVRTLHGVLRTGIDFEFAAVEVPPTMGGQTFQRTPDDLNDPIVELAPKDEFDDPKRFVRIDRLTAGNLNCEAVRKHAKAQSGVHFFKGGRQVPLSSGQRLFAYIVVNLLGSIRRRSLVLIDEPELFLHPALEVSLVSMLKSILQAFGSKALIATHSLVVVRETPRDCVHVFEPTPNGLVIKHPPFQTFGADMQRISSYVFGDKSVSKPFQQWIESAIGDSETGEEFLARIPPDDLNEELILEFGSQSRGAK